MAWAGRQLVRGVACGMAGGLVVLLAGCVSDGSGDGAAVAEARATLSPAGLAPDEAPAWARAAEVLWEARAWVAERLALARTDRAELSTAYGEADGNHYRQAILRDLHDALVAAERELVAARQRLQDLGQRLEAGRRAAPLAETAAHAVEREAAETRASAEAAELQRAGVDSALARLRGW